MISKQVLLINLLAGSLLLSGCDKDPLSHKGRINLPAPNTASSGNKLELINTATAAPTDKQAVRELEWDDLIPADWRPDSDLVFKYNNGEIGDDDPRIIALKKKMEQLQKLAPVNKQLDGLQVKLPGFVVPIDTDDQNISRFLLVPYHGACIHVPPPPANQIVFVKVKSGTKAKFKIMDTVWVTGTMKVEKAKNKIAEVSYTLYADKLETY